MIQAGAFDYVDIIGKAADASWLRNDVISNNIANNDTPGFKRQDVSFEGLLEGELKKSRYISLDKKVSSLELNRIDAKTYTDSSNFSYRIDKNNVDVDTENVELASNQIKYNGLLDSLTNEFGRFKTVIK